ncbi:lipid II flippase MurJ [Pseudomonas berkeleyensis]|uniref:Murein biosynthesis integral membrane protein MurJ n=1 Tax=Pseudomonas berkeleyensis TaxID=2726956 RepID=A0A7G5DMT5_9PSED|nr:lipid II flippase MurJ [Pseudomonas berkeleyensis]QMV63060.1 murein biosynthesis integral membrane protein MurJ [Pseudomonas berkeleyensis]WSO38516.1 lipid II flippase MurJ [Pseudomonas berkeleyensis]
MLGSAAWLTLVTLLGLALGFAREWLQVSAWGAGAQSDAFLVALFLPEAVRMSLAGGLLSAAALPLYLAEDDRGRLAWIQALIPQLALIGSLLSLLILLLAPWIVQFIGMGLAVSGQMQAAEVLRILAWCIPGLLLHALLSVPLQASERFVMAGLGSVLFNLPPVAYLLWMGQQSSLSGVAEACVLGSFLMVSLLLPWPWRQGWRPWHASISTDAMCLLWRRMLPLLGSNAASQGLALVERLMASFLGDGAVTYVNLARKLVNLPLVALMSLNQVLLGLMSSRASTERIPLLRRGVETASLLALPAGIGLVGSAPALVTLLLPAALGQGPLPLLLACFALVLVFGCWNALLARYAYSTGNTAQPLYCELLGSAINAALLLALPWSIGLAGIPLASLAGVLVTALALMRQQGVLKRLPWGRYWICAAALLSASAVWLFEISSPWLQLGLTTLFASLTMVSLACVLKPWRAT